MGPRPEVGASRAFLSVIRSRSGQQLVTDTDVTLAPYQAAWIQIRLAAFEMHLRTGRRKKLQPISFSDLNHARYLLLLRAQRTDFLEESFEPSRRHRDHEPTGSATNVAISVRHTAWCKDRLALLSGKRLPSTGEFIFALQDLEGLVLAMMNVRWRTSAGLINRFRYS